MLLPFPQTSKIEHITNAVVKLSAIGDRKKVIIPVSINNCLKLNPFDIYLGVSSGAMSLSYYIASQYKTYFSLSKEVSVNEKFLSYTHALSEQGYMDLKFLAKYAKQNNPLELQNMKESTENKQFYIVGTNLDNGKAVFLEPNKQNI